MANSASRDNWQKLIEQQEKSGLTQKAFCEQYEIKLSQFVYYRGQIKSKPARYVKSASVFSPVHLKKLTSVPTEEIRILLPNGFQCFFPLQVETNQIKRLLEVMLSC